MFRNALLSAALLTAGLAGAAQAQDPITVLGTGENFAVEYAPGYTDNIVGGGVVASITSGKDPRVTYSSANHVRPAGIPIFQGGSEGHVAYLPLQNSATLAAR